MDRPSQTAPEGLCGEIMAEARRQSGKIVNDARAEAAALLQEAAAKASLFKDEQLAAAKTETLRRTQLIFATIPVELGRERAARIENVLQVIYERARQQLLARQGFDYRAALVALASETIGHMTGEKFLLKVAPADRLARGDELARAIIARVGNSRLDLEILEDPQISDGGLIVQDSAGSQCWDNRLSARLGRLWPELRRQIASRTNLGSGDTRNGGAS